MNQAAALTAWTPLLAGLRWDSRTTLPVDPSFLLEGRPGIAYRADRWMFYHCGASPRLGRMMRTTGLVHAHFGPDAARLPGTARLARRPLVVTFHGYDITMPAVRAATEYGRLFRTALRIVAVSEFIRSELERAGAPPEKIVVLPIGIPLPADVARTGTAPQVLFVGRLVEVKGCGDLIDALARLPDPPPLKVIGDGPLREELERRALDLRLHVTFLGVQPPHVVDHEMRRSTVFCVPSRRAGDGAREGFGLVFAEASARLLPVISYASGGVPEAVSHGETGLLAAEGRVEELAGYLGAVLSDPDLGRRLGEQGRRRVERLFDIKRCTRRLESLYDEVAVRR